jgi:hypothetical protein
MTVSECLDTATMKMAFTNYTVHSYPLAVVDAEDFDLFIDTSSMEAIYFDKGRVLLYSVKNNMTAFEFILTP